MENKLRVGCCASADGWKPEAVEYDIAADHCRVRIDGEWHDVPADVVLMGLTSSDLPWFGITEPTPKGRWFTFAACCLEPADKLRPIGLQVSVGPVGVEDRHCGERKPPTIRCRY